MIAPMEDAARSDGMAQAVCRAIRAHLATGKGIPPSIRAAWDQWAELQGTEA